MRDHPLLAGVEQGVVASMLAGVEPRELARGSVLDTTAGVQRLVHLVLRGRLGVYLPASASRAMLLEVIGAGGVDGLLWAGGYHGHQSRALESSLVASLPAPALSAAAAADPKLNANLRDIVLARLARREAQMEALARRQPLQRLARQLAGLAEATAAGAGWVQVSFSHQMLADMLALRRETVTLHLQRLANLGAVRSDGRRYRLNRTVLERICQ